MDDEEEVKKEFDLEPLTVQDIMKTEGGRSFMWKHLQECGVFENIFNKDPILHAYSAGKRESGLNIERDLKEHAPDNYLKMIKENI